MQKLFSYVLIVLIATACSGNDKKEFEVSGTLKNAKANMVYLQETPLASGQKVMVDSSAIAKDGSYHLKASKGEEGLYHLFIAGEVYPFAMIINDASKIKVDADLNQPGKFDVSGSQATKEMKETSEALAVKWTEWRNMALEYDSLRKGGAPDSVLMPLGIRGNDLQNNIKSYVNNFVSSSKSPIAVMYILGSSSQLFTPEEFTATIDDMVKKFPDHKGLASVKEMNDRQAALAKQKGQQIDEPQWIGKDAPELAMADVNGKQVKLSSFRGKYVLVDFWASWCGPCRHENPNVVAAYNKYKNKNFTIVGVSLDSDKADWVDAINHDHLDWTQISDLAEWNSAAVSIYQFQGIPFNVLVDPAGKVIAQSLRGDKLEKTLEQVLK